MGFSGSGYKKGQSFIKKRPSGPIKLAFGLVEKNTTENRSSQNIVPQIKVTEPTFEKQEIKGYLDHSGVKYQNSKPIDPQYKARLLENLKRVFDEGVISQSRMLIDSKDGELRVSFPFDSTLVDRIKGLDRTERAWEPEEKCWRVFVGSFDDVLDILGRGVKISPEAFALMTQFIDTPYYCYLFKNKLAKLIVRESWFKEDGFSYLPKVTALKGSNYWLKNNDINKEEFNHLIDRIRNDTYPRKPFDHQFHGITYLYSNENAALLDEMGCGKSFQIASALKRLFTETKVERSIIVAPKSLIKTWQNELRLAECHDFVVCAGGPIQRKKCIESSEKIILIHYEGLRLEHENLSRWLGSSENGILVFDESQRIKNIESQTTQAALKIRESARRCIIATGTPIANRPLDLFSQYLVLDQGKTFGRKFHDFKQTFCEMETRQFTVGRKTIRKEYFVGVRNPAELRNRISQTALRRLKSEVLDLPPVIYKDYNVELSGLQKSHYQQMRDHLRIEVGGMSDGEIAAQASSIAVKLIRLAQIASNPILLDPGYTGPNSKFSELEEILDDVLSDETKKVIVWSHYVDNVNALHEYYLEKYGAVKHTGNMAIEERSESVERFRSQSDCRLFIATPQSAKEGLTLLPYDKEFKTDTMIYIDLSFDGGSYVQSQARFHRIGQTSERCLVIHLLAETTIDEKMKSLIENKILTAKSLLDGNFSDNILQDNTLDKNTILSMLD